MKGSILEGSEVLISGGSENFRWLSEAILQEGRRH